MSALKDITGQVFSYLTVIKRFGSNKGGNATWLCACKCGIEVVVLGNELRNGHTKSCGCYGAEARKISLTTHGKTKTKEYGVWRGMRERCNNRKHVYWKNYGGRGIKVCERWRNSFSNFLDDMGNVPPGKTLDRIDNDGDYEPNNCKWSTREEQEANKRKSYV